MSLLSFKSFPQALHNKAIKELPFKDTCMLQQLQLNLQNVQVTDQTVNISAPEATD